jgi:hypothetical protein
METLVVAVERFVQTITVASCIVKGVSSGVPTGALVTTFCANMTCVVALRVKIEMAEVKNSLTEVE